MGKAFDPYYRWLGIPPDEQPADHYRLLGIERFEPSPDVIETAADRQTVHLRMFRIGERAALADKLVAEVAAARQCLLDPRAKAVYDTRLRKSTNGGVLARYGPTKTAAPPVDQRWESLLAEADAAPAARLAPLPRRRLSLARWIIGGAKALVLAGAVVAIVGAIAWSVGRLRATIERPSATSPPSKMSVAQPLTVPLPASVPVEPTLTGSVAKSLTPPLLWTLSGPTRPVCAMAFAPDGHTLATGSKDGTVRLWETATGQMIWAKVAHDAEVNAVLFAPDGTVLASAGDDRVVRLWKGADGAPIRTLVGHRREIRAIDFSPDGRRLASAGHDRTVRLWNVGSGKLVREWDAHDDGIMALKFSPDGRLVATGSLDRTLRLWDPETGRLVRALAGHDAGVRALAFGGGRLVSGGEDGKWIVGDVATGEPVHSEQGHFGRILAVAFAPDGTIVATAGSDAAEGIRLWNAESGSLRTRLPGHAKAIGAIAFSPDGRILASGGYDRVVKLWQVALPATAPPAR